MRALKFSLIVFGIAAILGTSVILARFVFKINPKNNYANHEKANEAGNMFGNQVSTQELDPAQMLPVTTIIAPPKVEELNNNAQIDANAAQNAVSGCNITNQKPINIKNWENKGTLLAITEGENCANSLVKIIIKDDKNNSLFTLSAPAQDFGINSESKNEDFSKALDLALPNSAVRANAYPEWKSGADKPFGTEFDQATYEKIRKNDAPIICLKLPSAPQTCVAANPDNGEIKTFSRG